MTPLKPLSSYPGPLPTLLPAEIRRQPVGKYKVKGKQHQIDVVRLLL